MLPNQDRKIRYIQVMVYIQLLLRLPSDSGLGSACNSRPGIRDVACSLTLVSRHSRLRNNSNTQWTDALMLRSLDTKRRVKTVGSRGYAELGRVFSSGCNVGAGPKWVASSRCGTAGIAGEDELALRGLLLLAARSVGRRRAMNCRP